MGSQTLDLLYDRLFRQPLGLGLNLADHASLSTLTLAPATALIGLCPLFIHQYRNESKVVSSGHLLWAKLIAAIALIIVEFVNLSVSNTLPPKLSELSFQQNATRCIAVVCLLPIIHVVHKRTFRSSAILSAWFTCAIACDVTAARTYLSLGNANLISLANLSAALKIVLWVLEELPKSRDISDAQPREKIRWQSTCGFITRNLILWPYEELSFGFRHVDTIRQLGHLDPELTAERLSQRFAAHWSSIDQHSPHSLATCTVSVLFSSVFSTVVWRILFAIFMFSQYVYIYCLICFLENTERTSSESTRIFVGAIIIYFGRVTSDTAYTFSESHLSTSFQAVLTAAIYKKSLRLPKLLTSLDTLSVRVNVEAVVGIIPLLHKSLTALFEIGMSFYLITLLYGIFPVFIIVSGLLYKLAEWQIGKHMPMTQKVWTESTERRNLLSSTILSQIQHIKLIGAEKAAFDTMDQSQQTELNASIEARFWKVLLKIVVLATPVLLGPALATSKLYLDPHLENQAMRKMSIAMGLIIDLVGPVHFLVASTAHFRVFSGNMLRIQEFLLQREWNGKKEHDSPDDPSQGSQQKEATAKRPENQVAQFSNADIAPQKSKDAALINVCVTLVRGEVLMVTGPPRSGKTTFLLSFLRESVTLQGSVYVKSGLVAYCGQVTWICSSSIRHNVIGSLPFDPVRYNLILEACCLKEDLGSLPQQDETMIGIGGFSLTKEQEQKIALARAIYSQPEIIVVDDIFGVFNLSTANEIFARLFGLSGLLRKSLTTVVIATHNIPYLQSADHVLVIESDKTSILQAYSSKPEFHRRLAIVANRSEAASQTMKGNTSEDTLKQDSPIVENIQIDRQQNSLSKRQALVFYLRSFSPCFIYLCVSLAVIAAVVEHGGTVYVLIWAEIDIRSTTLSVGFWLFTALNYLATSTCFWLWFSKATPGSARRIQREVLEAVSRSGFEQLTLVQSDSFRQLFGTGIASVVDVLPDKFIRFCYICGATTYTIITTSLGTQYPFITIICLVGFTFLIYRNYFRVSRNMAWRESAKSIDDHFSGTAAGLQYIRSFGWQDQQAQQMYYFLDKLQLSELYTHSLARWRRFSTGILAFAVEMAVIATAIRLEHSISVVIISLISLSQCGVLAEGLIRFSAEFYARFDTLVYLHQFIASVPVDRQPNEEAKLPALWPRNGKVLLEKISVWHNQHDETAAPVLENVTAYVPGGWKVGIVGRPGSGKTSLILALLGFLKYTGRIVIDGVDISTVPRQVLRERIIIISQDSIDLDGKVRSCLDPWGLRHAGRAGQTPTDEQMETVLKRLKLWNRISEKGGLDGNMADMEFTPEQRKMMCVARACIHKLALGTRLVVVDDALADFHPKQYRLVRRAMREFMWDCTILMVAHRMESLTNVRMTIQMIFESAKVRIHQPMDDDSGPRDRELPPAMKDYGPVEDIPAELEEIVRLSEHGEESRRAQREGHQRGESSRQHEEEEEEEEEQEEPEDAEEQPREQQTGERPGKKEQAEGQPMEQQAGEQARQHEQ